MFGLARAHGLAGHIAARLAAAPLQQAIPGLEELHAWSRRDLARRMVRRASAARALSRLEAEGLRPILVKGFALAEEVYGSVTARSFGDTDILVRERDFPAARALLAAEGFTDVGGTWERRGPLLHATELIDRSGSAVDLHWRLSDSIPASFEDEIWRGARPPSGPGRLPGLRLDPAMRLLHLADHFAHHDFMSVKPVVDFHVCAATDAEVFDVDRLRRCADALRLDLVLEMTALFCRRRLDDAPALQALTSRSPSRRAVRFAEEFDPESLTLPVTAVRRWRLGFERRRRTLGPLRLAKWVARWLAPGPDALAERFGSGFRWSFYLRYYRLHALRLLKRTDVRLSEISR